ncbi:TPA: hypothetical protein ACH3X2_010153 [Trebouxia sp. C0005]
MAKHSVKWKFKWSLTIDYGDETWHAQLNRPEQTVHPWPLFMRANTQHGKSSTNNCVSHSRLSTAKNNWLLMHRSAAAQATFEEDHVSKHTMHHLEFTSID